MEFLELRNFQAAAKAICMVNYKMTSYSVKSVFRGQPVDLRGQTVWQCVRLFVDLCTVPYLQSECRRVCNGTYPVCGSRIGADYAAIEERLHSHV